MVEEIKLLIGDYRFPGLLSFSLYLQRNINRRLESLRKSNGRVPAYESKPRDTQCLGAIWSLVCELAPKYHETKE